jgi:hypothetical protein
MNCYVIQLPNSLSHPGPANTLKQIVIYALNNRKNLRILFQPKQF